MSITMNREYTLSLLQQLLETPSPTGYTHHLLATLHEEALRLGVQADYNHKGGLILTLAGQDDSRTIALSGHVDTLGAMVRAVKPDGKIRMTMVGGFTMNSIENEYCIIHTRSGKTYTGTILSTEPSVHVYDHAETLKRTENHMEVRIDEVVASKEDVDALGIAVGDYISFDARPVMTDSGYIKSRHLDDKASVAAMFGLLESAHTHQWKPRHTVKLLISNYEEVGHGTAYIPGDIDEMIAVDMGCIGDDLSCKETDVSICVKDSSGPYDYEMTGKLAELARREQIPFALDVYPHYGSDASAALRGGNNIRAALIGPGVHASHSMERTHSDAVINTARLLAAYITE
ncbi:M42 family metallopeptidase [Paenibacillus sp. WLX1005]|uniref:M42 family metallopeptidase n=1 Tax=Paenibacillus sp. WLX1005 TaxID=3243766 RepID=UPI003984577D